MEAAATRACHLHVGGGMEGVTKSPGVGVLVTSAISGALPFVISYSQSSYHAVNGAVVDAHYRDWIAVGCGGAAQVLGLIAIAVALRGRARPAMIGLCAAVLALGGYQLARGFGVFEPGASAQAHVATEIARDLAPPPAPAPRDPASCPDADACDRLAADLDRSDLQGALTARTRACDLGEKYACLEAAAFWEEGRAGTKDPVRTLALRQKGCDLGAQDGCTDAGVAYARGDGTARDLERGLGLMRRGCDLGSKIGCKNLAFRYRDGDGVPVDLAKSFTLAARACDEGGGVDTSVAGYVGAACTLAADSLLAGRGVRRDRKRAAEFDLSAVSWYDVACKTSATDCFDLALAFDQGRGVAAADPKKARDLYQAACDAGNFAACNNLGNLLSRGRGGARSVAMARQLFDRACHGGDDTGCANLKVVR
jgi:TPR repeat protein